MASVREPCEGSSYFIKNGCNELCMKKLNGLALFITFLLQVAFLNSPSFDHENNNVPMSMHVDTPPTAPYLLTLKFSNLNNLSTNHL